MKTFATRLRYWFCLLLFLAVAAFVLNRSRIASKGALSDPQRLLQFTSRGHALGFATNGIYVAGDSHLLHVEFVDGQKINPVANGIEKGRTRPLASVSYSNIWNGITLHYDAPAGAIARSTYRIEPGADAGEIRLRYNAPVSIENNGALRVDLKSGRMIESAPRAWQERSGKNFPVEVAFAQCNQREIGFSVGDYDKSMPLFIDPSLTWNTFLGSSGDDHAEALTLDGFGNVYVAGTSNATWGSPVNAYTGGYDAFVVKPDTNGNLIWNSFVGSSANDGAQGIAVDLTGNVLITGFSMATWGSPVLPFTGIRAAFAAKLDSNGNLIWNTFLGGSADCVGNAAAVDGLGNVVVTGYSTSSFGSPIRAYNGDADIFVAKLDLAGTLIWNTFLGGTGTDRGNGVAVGVTGNVYVVGFSTTNWGSPVRPFPGPADGGLAAKLDPNGNLIWSTFLGGSALAVDVGISENVDVVGFSQSTWGSPIRPFGGNQSGWAAQLDSNGNLLWNTFLGANTGGSAASAVASDLSGNVYVGGVGDTPWGSPPSFVSSNYVFAAQLDPNGNLAWNFFPGSGADLATGIGVDATQNVYLAGDSDFTWGDPIIPMTAQNQNDAFVAKINPAGTPTPTPTPTPSPTPTATPTPTPACEIPTLINANFNGTTIHSGSYIWFNGVLKPSGLGSQPVSFRFTQQTITSASFSITVPDALVTFDPAATVATTTFSGGMWVTRVPSSGLAGNTFLSAVAFQVPTDIPGGLKDITWNGTIVFDTPGTSLHWQWAAAVYSIFSSDHTLLGVKPVDDNKASIYKNSDHAGTPELFKGFVIGGATGGGGANYTGGYSGTANIGPCQE